MQFGVVVLAAIVLHKMFACCEAVPSGFVGLLWGMVCAEVGAWLGPFSFVTHIAYRCCSVCVRAYAGV